MLDYKTAVLCSESSSVVLYGALDEDEKALNQEPNPIQRLADIENAIDSLSSSSSEGFCPESVEIVLPESEYCCCITTADSFELLENAPKRRGRKAVKRNTEELLLKKESEKLSPKMGKGKEKRRRQIDPTTCERNYSDDEVEFMKALDLYKQASGRMFPTCSETLEVIRKLGYVKMPAADKDELSRPDFIVHNLFSKIPAEHCFASVFWQEEELTAYAG